VLIALVLATQAAAAFSDSARRPILFVSLLLLDGLGAVYSWKAARHGETRLTWRLAAAGRAFSLSSTITFAVDAVHSGSGWWWSGVGCGLAMFVSLTASALSMSTQRLRGAQRWAFMAEVGTVLSSGFMVVWYFVLGDAMHGPATSHWIYKLGYPLGNLLLLSAVSAVLLRGAVARLSQPLALLLAGMFAYAIGDVAFTALVLESERPSASTPAAAGLVFSLLVLTVAAMRRSAQGPVEPAGPEPAQMPAWSGQLPYVAVGVGSLLMLVAMVRQHMPPIWSGLTIAQTVMTAALAVRQVISLRDSRRLNGADALTGLANVTGLQGALDRSIRARPGPALLLIDLDGFKQINDG
jgi:hypothetical protein